MQSHFNWCDARPYDANSSNEMKDCVMQDHVMQISSNEMKEGVMQDHVMQILSNEITL